MVQGTHLRISIPFSTIKSEGDEEDAVRVYQISIPFSTIKSLILTKSKDRQRTFQFHLVRLKDSQNHRLPFLKYISIPFSTIKRYGHIHGFKGITIFQFHLVRLKASKILLITSIF